MAAFRFSRRAESDLLSIGDYTLRTWGKAQAARYLGELEVCCQTLSDNPGLGRLCDEVRPGLRRLEHGQHVVFYRQERGGILVSRILHQRMLPELHSIGVKTTRRSSRILLGTESAPENEHLVRRQLIKSFQNVSPLATEQSSSAATTGLLGFERQEIAS